MDSFGSIFTRQNVVSSVVFLRCYCIFFNWMCIFFYEKELLKITISFVSFRKSFVNYRLLWSDRWMECFQIVKYFLWSINKNYLQPKPVLRFGTRDFLLKCLTWQKPRFRTYARISAANTHLNRYGLTKKVKKTSAIRRVTNIVCMFLFLSQLIINNVRFFFLGVHARTHDLLYGLEGWT